MNNLWLHNIISESIHSFLNEYSADQRLPFDDDKFKNKNYLEQYTDWLEDFGKYGTLPPSKLDFWDEVKKAIEYGVEHNPQGRHGNYFDDDNIYLIYNKLRYKINYYLKFNENGNLYVERAVKINDSINSYDKSDSNGKDPMSLYNSLVKNYNNNVGGCWSFKEGKGRAYCAENFGSTLLLKGYIRTDDIDFIKTVLLNYKYNEDEIRVKPNAKVELFEVLADGKYKLQLKDTLIVSSSYFGNNGKFNGRYAYIDDGFGHTNQIIDRNGKILDLNKKLNAKNINNLELLSNGLYKAKIDHSWVLLDDNLKPISDVYAYIGDFSCGLANVQLENKKWSYIDTNGNLIKKGKILFDYTSSFHNNFAAVKLNNKYSFINTDGKLIGDGNLWFDDLNNFVDGFAKVNLGFQWSYINTNGYLIYNGKLWFDNANNFFNGLGRVELNDKYSFINTDGKLIGNGNLWFDNADYFDNGFAKVELDNKWYRIDTKGNFYDYETEQPISSPIKRTNENIKYLKKIIKETITNYLNL